MPQAAERQTDLHQGVDPAEIAKFEAMADEW